MGRMFALTLSMPMRALTKNKKPVTDSAIMPKINFGMLIFAALVMFGLLYLFQVNSISTKGYEVSRLQKQVQTLTESAKRLELESAELKSIQGIEARVKTLNMVPSAGVNYVKDQGYALKQ